MPARVIAVLVDTIGPVFGLVVPELGRRLGGILPIVIITRPIDCFQELEILPKGDLVFIDIIGVIEGRRSRLIDVGAGGDFDHLAIGMGGRFHQERDIDIIGDNDDHHTKRSKHDVLVALLFAAFDLKGLLGGLVFLGDRQFTFRRQLNIDRLGFADDLGQRHRAGAKIGQQLAHALRQLVRRGEKSLHGVGQGGEIREAGAGVACWVGSAQFATLITPCGETVTSVAPTMVCGYWFAIPEDDHRPDDMDDLRGQPGIDQLAGCGHFRQIGHVPLFPRKEIPALVRASLIDGLDIGGGRRGP